MTSIALKMLWHNRGRFVSTVIGVSVAFFLSAAQIGLLVGWCNTTSAVVRHAGVDLWVMARQTSAFDYGTAIPKNRIYQVRSVSGVDSAEGMIMTWVFWKRPDGRNMSIELVGLDDGLRGGPWRMRRGTPAEALAPESIIVDELYCNALGVSNVGDEIEILGSRAVVRGLCQGVRTFTAAPFVFTSLASAVKYDPYYKEDQITYVLVRCAEGVSPAKVRDAIQSQVSAVEVLTTREFAVRTILYWMFETGVGITVVTTAILGLLVGTVITSQTLYAITQDHLEAYATLLAIGFGFEKLIAVVLWQATVLAAVGIAGGTLLFAITSLATAATPIPIETTPLVFAGVVVVNTLCCIAASLMSMRTVLRIDPVRVFHA